MRQVLVAFVLLFHSALSDAAAPFFAAPVPSGSVAVNLCPTEAVAPGLAHLVTFGLPLPRGSLSAAQLGTVRLTKNGVEQPLYVDQLTPWHLRVLSLLHNPVEWMEWNRIANPGWSVGGVSTVIEHCFPQHRGQRDTYDQIVRDLQVEGLLGQGQFIHLTMTERGMLESRTTERGKRFVKFITVPV